MTLPNYFIRDSHNTNTVIYYFRCSETQYACVEYYLPGVHSFMTRGSWAGSFYEYVDTVEEEWDEWTTVIYSIAIEKEPDEEVAQDLFNTLIFRA